MGDLRLFGFISLACVSMLIVQAWQQDYGVKPLPETTTEQVVTDNNSEVNLALPAAAPVQEAEVNLQQDNLPTLARPDVPVAIATTETKHSIENEKLRIVVNLKGGDIVESDLIQYAESLEDETPITLLSDTERKFFVAKKHIVFELANSSASSEKFVYQLANKQKDSLTLFWESKTAPGLRLEKHIAFEGNTYQVKVTDSVINNTNALYRIKSQQEFSRVYHEKDHQQGFTQTFTGGVFYNPEVKYDKYNMSDLSKGKLNISSDKAWAAMIQHYFGAAWLPAANEENDYYSDGDNNDKGYRYKIGFTSKGKDIAPGQTYTNDTTLFVGPKIKEDLEAAAEGLDLIVDYGIFTPVSQPLFATLKYIHNYVGNWGWAIILLTFGIKLIFFYPSQISYKSMAKMREAQPKMQEIRDRYKDDKQRQGQAMMELYKKEKINPAAGCLPMLIQVPVFISLYWALLESVELRQAPWALWIEDLAAKDPFYIMPLIMGATMFIQQKLNPQPTDPIQAKVFAYLPVVFTVFFMFFPAGLVLYWITNNVLTIAQQWYIYKFVTKTR